MPRKHAGARLRFDIFLEDTTDSKLEHDMMAYTAAINCASGDQAMLTALACESSATPFEAVHATATTFKTQEAFLASHAAMACDAVAEPIKHALFGDVVHHEVGRAPRTGYLTFFGVCCFGILCLLAEVALSVAT